MNINWLEHLHDHNDNPTLFVYLNQLQSFPQANVLAERVLQVYKRGVYRNHSRLAPVVDHDFFRLFDNGWECPSNILLASQYVPDHVKENSESFVTVIQAAWKAASIAPFVLSREIIETCFSIPCQSGWEFDVYRISNVLCHRLPGFRHHTYRNHTYRNVWTEPPAQEKRKKYKMLSEEVRKAWRQTVLWQNDWLQAIRRKLFKILIHDLSETILCYMVGDTTLDYHKRENLTTIDEFE
jgi:hypothetical protein